MTEAIAIFGAIIVALLTLFGVMLGHLYARVGKLEGQVKEERDYNNRMWVWARNTIDLYYIWRRTGAPEPLPIPKRSESDK